MHSMLAELDENTLVISVNNRLARELQDRYDQTQAAMGKQVWATPDITPLSAWLKRNYEQLIDTGYCKRILLNSHQERLIWEQIVKRSGIGRKLLRPAAAAKSAQQAMQLMLDWQLSSAQLGPLANDETAAFLMWLEQYQTRCKNDSLVSPAALKQLSLEAIKQQQITLPKKLILSGFDSHSPLQQQLWDAMQANGCDIEHQQEFDNKTKIIRTSFDNEEDEVRTAAFWAKDYVKKNPESQIAIVSPKLEERRDLLQRIATEVLNPAARLPGSHPTTQFNLSLGLALSEFPLVSHLLLALQLCRHKAVKLNDIGQLLKSPFIGGHSKEWDKRAQLNYILCDDGLPEIDLSRFLFRISASEEFSIGHAPDLIERLQQLKQTLDALPKSATPNEWSGHLLEIIQVLGWPGDQSLSSHEYQQAERLRRSISEFSSLSRIQHSMTFNDALMQFQQVCDATLFQAESAASPIQIMGSLEAAGMPFDAIWLLSMDDKTWPQAPNPNPLLPSQLQRDLDMPHSSATRELEFSEQLTQRLIQATNQLFLSHAHKQGDQDQRPSPLTQSIPHTNEANLNINKQDIFLTAAQATGISADLPKPEQIAPAESPRGGSHLLSSQASCPFKAVAYYRLSANRLPETSTTPDARLQGMIVHELLQRVWIKLEDSHKLQQQNDDDLKQLISPLAKETLVDFGRRRPDIYIPAFIELEQQRLTELTMDWLDLEKQRSLPFKVVQLEQKQQVEIKGLKLNIQADRIDQLDDGGLVVIDYKTSPTAKPKGWTDERPSELQVPLYCIEQEASAAALIARVSHNKVALLGEAAISGIAPKVEAFEEQQEIPDWSALVEHWRERISHLATEIMNGVAEIAPLDASACTYCGMQSLCRIKQLESSDSENDNKKEAF